MAILTNPPEWRVPGTKPPRNIIEELGWEVASHPPAPWFNWFFHRVFESLLELESATLARVVNEAGVPGIMAGPESDRPDSTPETEGRIYIATDTKRVFRDRGNGWDLLNTPEAIGAETPAGAQAKADAAAGAALSAAKAYADGAVAAHAGRTDNPHGVTKSQVGLGNVENYPVASQQEAEAGTANNRYMTPQRTAQAIAALAPVKSVAGRTGAVTLSKSDVGLGNVENYGIATQAEAEAGSVNNKYMTPLRVAQAIAALGASRSWVETTFYPRSLWASSASASGYVKFPNGIIIQWGLSPSGTSDGVSVTFPIAFPNACLVVVTSKAEGVTYEARTTNLSRTGMTLVNNPGGINTGRSRWVAIGY